MSSHNIRLGEDHSMDISDPSSPNFGKHWTPQQVHDFFLPSVESVDAVREWLNASGIPHDKHKITSSSGHISFAASIDEIKSLLVTEYYVWEHSETGHLTLSCDEYHVPQHIQQHIDFIAPTIGLGVPSFTREKQRRKMKRDNMVHPKPREIVSNIADLDNCYSKITPACIKALYQIPDSPSTAQKGNEMGIYEFYDIYDQSDLDAFFWSLAPNIPNGTAPILQSIDGGSGPTNASQGGIKSLMDFDIAFPILYPQGIKLYQTIDQYTANLMASQNNNGSSKLIGLFDPWLDALDASYCTYDGGDDSTVDPQFPDGQGWNQSALCGVYKATNVISISYEVDEAAYPIAYAQRQCQEYMKLGLMGTSVIFSSGDNGTLSRLGSLGCLDNVAQNPSFPATCPYVTSVGATQIKYGNPITAPEEAVDPNDNIAIYGSAFTSGGGLSNYFTVPDYQKSTVVSFFANNSQLPNSNSYNHTGRGFPDVSANGWNTATWVTRMNSSGTYLQGGTSAATPIFASIINRLNEERLAANKGPIGFLNPILYNNPGMLNDIVSGYNLACNGTTGFYATKGWDPVTGLGTPNYPKMRDIFLALPSNIFRNMEIL